MVCQLHSTLVVYLNFLCNFQADANHRSLPPHSNSTHDKSAIVSKPPHTVRYSHHDSKETQGEQVPSASDKKREANLAESAVYHCVDSYNNSFCETQENIGLHTENLLIQDGFYHYDEVICEGVSVQKLK